MTGPVCQNEWMHTPPAQLRRVLAILEDIEKNLGRPLSSPLDELASLANACLEGPLSENYEDASTEVCEVLIHLKVLTGDE